MDVQEVTAILAEVKFPGFTFKLLGDFAPGTATYVKAVFSAPDHDAPDNWREQHTRRWLLSRHMTRSEVVQTVLKCVLTAVEHEAREQFRYRGQRIFGPHFDVEGLVELCRGRSLDVRKETA